MADIITKGAEIVHSAVASLAAVSPIKIGHELPAIPVKEGDPNSLTSIHNLPGKIILVGVPGAFTPTCSSQVPGYVEQYDKFAEKGITGIYVITVNDTFVVKAWKTKITENKETQVHFLADDKSSFVSALGLVFDATPVLGSPRSKRFVLIVDNGKVEHIFVEKDPSQLDITAADNVIQKL